MSENGHVPPNPVEPRCGGCRTAPIQLSVRAFPALVLVYCATCGAVVSAQITAPVNRVVPATTMPGRP